MNTPWRTHIGTALGGMVVGAVLALSFASLRGALAPPLSAAATQPSPTTYTTILTETGMGAANGVTTPVTTPTFTIFASGARWRIVMRETCSESIQAAPAQSIGVSVLTVLDTGATLLSGYVALLGSCVDGQSGTAVLSEREAGRFQLRVQAWEPWMVSVQSLEAAA